jgi:hypothetical protein
VSTTKNPPTYRLRLESCGNIDFGQDNNRSLPGVPKGSVNVPSLRAASAICRAYIEKYELGGGNWCGGAVFDATSGEHVAHISYNGRVWRPGAWPQPEIQLEPDDGATFMLAHHNRRLAVVGQGNL